MNQRFGFTATVTALILSGVQVAGFGLGFEWSIVSVHAVNYSRWVGQCQVLILVFKYYSPICTIAIVRDMLVTVRNRKRDN